MQAEEMMRVRIRNVLTVPGISRLVAAYFDSNGPFAGISYDLLGENPPDSLVLDDLLAATLLDISWRPLAIRRLTSSSDFVASQLAGIPHDLDLWDAKPEVLKSVSDLHQWLDDLPGVGSVIASKLLARKRPRLVPIHDDVVLRVLTPPKNQFWATLATALTEPVLRDDIEALRPDGVPSPSLLRLLDVAIWTRYSRSISARAARRSAGVSEPE